jgi:aldose 1-epimerase
MEEQGVRGAKRNLIAFAFGVLLIFSFMAEGRKVARPEIKKQPFGKTANAEVVDLYTLTNANGVQVSIINLGGIVTSLKVPDRNGKLANVVLGFDTVEGYLENRPFFGAIVGRYANRIAKGSFSLEGKQYSLPKNDGENTLHGGIRNFGKVIWTAKEVNGRDSVGLSLGYLSKDGEEGFPGNLSVTVAYTLTNQNELRIDYAATTDKTTVVNLSHHSYFNLAGDGNILNHEIMISADRFTPVDQRLIPTGELRAVSKTPMDFVQQRRIGERIDQSYDQLLLAGGYDHNWVLNGGGAGPTLAARVTEPSTGRVLEVLTTEPGMQFYTGNFLDGSLSGSEGRVFRKRYGFCLETQHFPDSPNKPGFPTTILKPGQTYKTTTIYRFSAK